MDPIADMLIMIKNANRAGHESIMTPFSNIKQAIATSLLKEGFITNISKKVHHGFPVLELTLKYENNNPKVTGIQRVSKPSRRMYLGVKEIFPVKNGHGLMMLSTPKGIMSGRQARRELVGGEILFKIW